MHDEQRYFRVAEGVEAGLTVGRMRGPGFVAPFWGIRGAREPQTAAERALAFAPRLPQRAFFCGVTAAALWQIPLPRSGADDVHIGVPAGARRIEVTSGVRAHHFELHPGEVVVHPAGVRVTSVERTFRDLATSSGLALGELVAAGDHLIRRRQPMTTLALLRVVAARAAGRRGSVVLREALSLLHDDMRSPAETRMRLAIRAARLPDPVINENLYGRSGQFLGQPDFRWPDARVLVEYEGDHHRTDRQQWHRDLQRFGRFQEEGWIALRATAADYRRPATLLAQLARLLHRQ